MCRPRRYTGSAPRPPTVPHPLPTRLRRVCSLCSTAACGIPAPALRRQVGRCIAEPQWAIQPGPRRDGRQPDDVHGVAGCALAAHSLGAERNTVAPCSGTSGAPPSRAPRAVPPPGAAAADPGRCLANSHPGLADLSRESRGSARFTARAVQHAARSGQVASAAAPRESVGPTLEPQPTARAVP